ncbi:type II secretion system F family protein [Candidatus Peregrinibacteria bacterium]|nr:type II secretion system F family protein [Candidatus Peregrinibacteria bacterium]
MKNKEIIIGGVSGKELLLFAKQMHAAARAGYNSSQALELARTQSKGRLKQILETVSQDVQHGAYLYESLGKFKKYFSPLFLNLIKTGELSGSLQENLKELTVIIEKDMDFRHKIRSAMMYPMFILIAVAGLGLAIALFVLPSLIPLFGSMNVELPLSTRILLWFARVFDTYGVLIFSVFFGLVITLIILFRQAFFKPVSHWIFLKIPILGRLIRQLNMARFGRSIASLVRSGMPIDESLKVTASVVTNHYYQSAIESILPIIRKGQPVAEALSKHSNFFDDIFIKLLALGESTAGLEDACDNIAEYFEGEVDDSMKNLTISLEPILIIFVGLIVAFVAFSIIGPIYKITGSIR